MAKNLHSVRTGTPVRDTEREVLGAFTYARNRTLLPTDTSVLPDDRATRAPWNHRLPDYAPVRVEYHMNRVQVMPEGYDHIVTLNDDGDVDPARVVAAIDYAHPVFTTESVAAQRRLRSLDGPTLVYAGAHYGWGFHEDGCRAGVEAAAPARAPAFARRLPPRRPGLLPARSGRGTVRRARVHARPPPRVRARVQPADRVLAPLVNAARIRFHDIRLYLRGLPVRDRTVHRSDHEPRGVRQ